jgi:hypothetical protein
MKTKNVALALIATLFAVGSAFASHFFAQQTVYVRGFATMGSTTVSCFDTGVKCESTGSGVCSVRIHVADGGDDTVSPSLPNKAFQDITTCASQISVNSNSTIQLSALSIYGLEN